MTPEQSLGYALIEFFILFGLCVIAFKSLR